MSSLRSSESDAVRIGPKASEDEGAAAPCIRGGWFAG